jgi:glycosyl transferase family 1
VHQIVPRSICFVVDQPGWAFDRATRPLAEELERLGIRATRCFQARIPATFIEEYVFVCWWPTIETIAARMIAGHKVLCRVADMGTWNENAPPHWQRRFSAIVPHVSAFVGTSQEIVTRLRERGHDNSFAIRDPVDAAEFTAKTYSFDDRPRFGWCGNPRALEGMGFRDLKGLSILTSLRSLPDIDFVTATGAPARTMPAWYRSLDVYVCASRLEGTPMPVLEAMAVGNIVISTPVGIVPEINSPGVFTFDGSREQLLATAREVLARRSEWPGLGQENRRYAAEHCSAAVSADALHQKLWVETSGARDSV